MDKSIFLKVSFPFPSLPLRRNEAKVQLTEKESVVVKSEVMKSEVMKSEVLVSCIVCK